MKFHHYKILVIIVLFFYSNSKILGQNNSSLKVITLVPSLHEIMFELGLGHHVVATSKFSSYPDSSMNIPRLGGLYDVNVEAIIQFHPDYVFIDSSQVLLAKKSILERSGIKVLSFRFETLNDIFKNIQRISQLFNYESKGEALIQRVKDSLNIYASKLQSKISHNNRNMIIIIGRNPSEFSGIYAAGNETFLSQLFEMSGFHNVLEQKGYFPLSPEYLLRKKLDYIVEIKAGINYKLAQKIQSEWKSFCKNYGLHPKIVVLHGNYVAVPGPRIYLILKEFYLRLGKM